MHVIHLAPYIEPKLDIFRSMPSRPEPVPTVDKDKHVVEGISNHCPSGRGFQLLTLIKYCTTHDAAWQPKKDFVDEDARVTEVWQEYTRQRELVQPYT